MSLEELGNVGEFIGGVAVIVSLLYLAVQIRQNSRIMRAAGYQSFNEANARVLLAMTEGPASAETMTKGLPDLRALGPAESFQFVTLVVALLQSFQTVYFQHREGLLPDDLWRRHRGVARWWLGHRGVQTALKLIGPSFDPAFLAEVTPEDPSTSEAPTRSSAARRNAAADEPQRA